MGLSDPLLDKYGEDCGHDDGSHDDSWHYDVYRDCPGRILTQDRKQAIVDVVEAAKAGESPIVGHRDGDTCAWCGATWEPHSNDKRTSDPDFHESDCTWPPLEAALATLNEGGNA